MPIPKPVTRFNRRVANPVIRRIAGRVPPLALLTHRGRRSGTIYRIPIMAFPSRNAFVIALTYGRDVDWLRNVLEAGGCELKYRGRRYVLDTPVLFERDPRTLSLPWLVRFILHRLKVTGFLRLRVASGAREV